MIEQTIAIIKHALVITSFVFAMMLVIEYVNVLTAGGWSSPGLVDGSFMLP